MRELRAEKDRIKASELNGAAGVQVTEKLQELQKERDWFCTEALRLS